MELKTNFQIDLKVIQNIGLNFYQSAGYIELD